MTRKQMRTEIVIANIRIKALSAGLDRIARFDPDSEGGRIASDALTISGQVRSLITGERSGRAVVDRVCETVR